MAFSGGPSGKNLPTNAGDIRDVGSVLGLGRSLGGGHDNPVQYPCLENSMDCIVHGGRKELDMTEQLSLTYIQKSAQISQQFDESCKLSQSVNSVQFSHSVMSGSLRSHELQHAKPPCLSPTHRAHSNSRPLSR